MENDIFDISNLDVSSFNEEKATDNTFFKLSTDEKGNGSAIVRFLPDPNNITAQLMYQINVNTERNGEKRWFAAWSPQTIGKPDPFQEEWARLWQAGMREESRTFNRKIRYLTNVYVVKDPKNPDNEGKVFLYEMPKTMMEIVKNIILPSEEEKALGAQPKALYNPVKGYNFKIIRKKVNGFPNFQTSCAEDKESSLFKTVDEAVAFIKENCYNIKDRLKESAFMSYEELVEKLKFVKFEDSPNTVNTSNTENAKTAETVSTDSVMKELDDILNS